MVAAREADAVRAAGSLAVQARWDGGRDLRSGPPRPTTSGRQPAAPAAVGSTGPPSRAARAGPRPRGGRAPAFDLHPAVPAARLDRPVVAVARFEDGRLEVWSYSQGVELLRLALAEVLRLDAADVTVTHVPGAAATATTAPTT